MRAPKIKGCEAFEPVRLTNEASMVRIARVQERLRFHGAAVREGFATALLQSFQVTLLGEYNVLSPEQLAGLCETALAEARR